PQFARCAVAALATLILAVGLSIGQPAGARSQEPAATPADDATSTEGASPAERKAQQEAYSVAAKRYAELANKRSTTTEDERPALEKEITKAQAELSNLRLTMKGMGIDEPSDRGVDDAKFEPDVIDVGEVYVGSTVEASACVFFEAKQLRGFYNDKDTA